MVLEDTPQDDNNTSLDQTFDTSRLNLDIISDASVRVRNEIHKFVIGQDKMIDLMLVALFAEGHVLLEGVPGVAKTLTARLLAQTLSVGFSRIQFTPDLMPSDILGTTIYNLKSSSFEFKSGAIFSNVILIDEINRAPAKTQAALFEVMEEQQVTVDGVTYPMSYPFFVMATQNPIEQEGTYRLPEAQLDRFIFRIKLTYPTLEEEKQILLRFKNQFKTDYSQVKAVLTPDDIRRCRKIVQQITLEDHLVEYIAKIVHQTRQHGALYLGASPRASLAIMKSSKAVAALHGREFVTPDDIQQVVYPILNHRIILTPEREMEGMHTDTVIKDIIQKIEVPR